MADAVRRTTRQHRSGNGFSVRIPRELAYAKPDQELEIEAVGETLVLRPAQNSIDEVFARMDELRARGAMGPDDDALIRPEWPEHRSPK